MRVASKYNGPARGQDWPGLRVQVFWNEDMEGRGVWFKALQYRGYRQEEQEGSGGGRGAGRLARGAPGHSHWGAQKARFARFRPRAGSGPLVYSGSAAGYRQRLRTFEQGRREARELKRIDGIPSTQPAVPLNEMYSRHRVL